MGSREKASAHPQLIRTGCPAPGPCVRSGRAAPGDWALVGPSLQHEWEGLEGHLFVLQEPHTGSRPNALGQISEGSRWAEGNNQQINSSAGDWFLFMNRC